MHLIPGAGHWVAYEAADAFNAKLIEVLRCHPERSEGSMRP